MDPLSRSMRIVQMAQKQVAEQTSRPLSPPRELDPPVGCSTPIPSDNGPETSLSGISYTELVPFSNVVNNESMHTGHDMADSFNAHIRPNLSGKGNILTHGNEITNCMLSYSNSTNMTPDIVADNEGTDPSLSNIEDSAAFQAMERNPGNSSSPPGCYDINDTATPRTMTIIENTIDDNGVHETSAEGSDDARPIDDTQEDAGHGKRRKADASKWKKVVSKAKRARGEAYMGRKYIRETGKYEVVQKPAKVMRDRCHCKTTGVKCDEVSDEKRAEIHNDVWIMSWPQREVFVKSLIQRNVVGRHRVEQSESSRQNTLRYHLNTGNLILPVCKKMFLNTTGITQHFIRAQLCGTVESVARVPIVSSKREQVKEFLKTLDTMPAHYCRKDTQKKYFDRSFDSKMDVYRVYKEWCDGKGIRPASRQILSDEVDIGNFAIFRPRKDLCDTCVSHAEGNVTDEAYQLHRLRKEQARAAKEHDKALAASSNGTIKMITMDLQAVLLAPALNASALYYRTTLCVHNFTIFDTDSRDVCCYVWHEAEGGLTANEFASCVCSYISTNVTAPCKSLIIFSDGCPYQNRNSTLAKALAYTAQKLNITITHKYLEKGHTQMEVDSVHKTIEDKIKHKSIYSPSDYVRYMKEARHNPFPYRVEYLDHTFFKNYINVCSLNTIRPGKKKGDPQVVDIRCLEYNPEGQILFKLIHEDDWQELVVRGNSTRIVNDPVQLFQRPRNISSAKWTHLQELKTVIPRDLHTFYDSLPHD